MKPAFHLPRTGAVSVLAVLTCLLAGCGQKGPLYLPAKQPQMSRPAPRTSPPTTVPATSPMTPTAEPTAGDAPASR